MIIETPAENMTIGIAGQKGGERTRESMCEREKMNSRASLRIEIEVDPLICIDMSLISAEQFTQVSHIPTEKHSIL